MEKPLYLSTKCHKGLSSYLEMCSKLVIVAFFSFINQNNEKNIHLLSATKTNPLPLSVSVTSHTKNEESQTGHGNENTNWKIKDMLPFFQSVD